MVFLQSLKKCHIMPLYLKEIIGEVSENNSSAPINKLIYNSNDVKGNNEFLFFIKPEITIPQNGIKLENILKLIFSKLEEFNLNIKSVRLINASYLEKHNIIAQHYGVINKLSKDIRKYISDEAKEKFNVVYNDSFSSADVYGSIEFLKAFPHFTPTGLAYLWQNSTTEKLVGATYSQKLTLDGKPVYLFNGFHPRQLEHFTARDRSIIAMWLCGNTDWQIARNNFIGKTNPSEAEKGSIRNELLKNKDEFGLINISASMNGVHLSAGPIEGLVELMRYNSDFEKGEILKVEDFNLGKQLVNAFGKEKTEWLLENPNISSNGRQTSVFDLTEEKNSNEIFNLLI